MKSPLNKLNFGESNIMKKAFAPTLILASLFVVGTAQANPYGSWSSSVSDDDKVTIEDSFNRESSYSKDIDVREDNDTSFSLTKSLSKVHTEDNDIHKTYTRQEDNDVTKTDIHKEDNDSWYSSDDDYSWSNREDNDVHEDNDITTTTDVDVDFLLAKSQMSSHKYQDQHAGHQADQTVLGSARGHEVGVVGGPTSIKAGNEETVFFGPAMVNNNTNQMPTNIANVYGPNGGDIYQRNDTAGRDSGGKGNIYAPVGNTSAFVSGDVGQQSQAGVSQRGDSGNSIADTMSAPITK